jgi:ABC-type antimicrobial peptide transport system permease subunit
VRKITLNNFRINYIGGSITRNYRRSITIIIAIMIPILLISSLLMWLETAPRIAIQSAFEERAYELEVRHTIYVPDSMNALQAQLEHEPLVDGSFITQPTLFLYNMNNRSPLFNVIDHPQNESDFYISPDLRDCAHLVEDEFLRNIASQITLEEGSNLTLKSGGVVISRRMLTQIKLATNHTLNIGDKIDFGIATNLPEFDRGESRLFFFEMIKHYNLTIRAIFDRIPQSSLFYPDFFPESLGDGIFIPRDIFNDTMLQKMENRVTTPHMFIRFDREKLSRINTFAIESEINSLALRIESGNVWFVSTVHTDEINLIISNYERARIIILFLFIPLVLVAFIFLLTSTSYTLGQRRVEIKLLRFKGATSSMIILLFSLEFLLLASIGFTLGVILAIINTAMIPQSTGFLEYSSLLVKEEILDTLLISWQTWILGGIFVCATYFLTTAHQIRKLIHEEQDEELLKTRSVKEKGLSRKNTDVGILIVILVLFFVAIQSDIVNQLSLDPQLMGLYLGGATILWLILGSGLARLSSEILPRISRISQFLFKTKHKLITVSLIRKRPQILSIITLISLTVSLAVFSTFYSISLTHNTQKNVNYLIGSDFKVFTDDKSINFTNNLINLPGVESAAALSQTSGSIGSHTVLLIGIDPLEYFKTCYWDSESIVLGESAESILTDLADDISSGAVINDFLSHNLRANLGDNITVHRLFGTIGQEYNFSVKGVMKSAPGVGKLYSGNLAVESFSRFGGMIFVNQELLENFQTQTTRIFLVKSTDTSKGGLANTKEILEEYSPIRLVYDRNQDLEVSYDFMAISGVAGILSADFILSLMIGVIGVGVFYNYVVSERLQEYAIYRAFGGTKNTVFALVISETIITVLFGLILGLGLGSGFVLGFILVSRSVILSVENVFELKVVTSPLLILLVLITSFTALLLASSFVARRTRDINTANLLRNL